MLSRERHSQILAQINANATLSVLDASRALGVSTETIRRDLVELENRGLLRRVHGGAVGLGKPTVPEKPHNARATINATAKRTIGMIAAQLVSTERTLFIDVGTTTQQLARALSRGYSGAVITPSLLVAAELQHSPRITVLVTPGFVQYEEPSLSGTPTNEFLRNYHFDTAFISCSGMSAERAVTDYKVDYATLSRTAIENADKSVLLVDGSKDGVVADAAVCGWESISDVVTDRVPSASTLRALDEFKIRTLYPRPRTGAGSSR